MFLVEREEQKYIQIPVQLYVSSNDRPQLTTDLYFKKCSNASQCMALMIQIPSIPNLFAQAHAPTNAINEAPPSTAQKASHLIRPFKIP
jgi:hypothetical protein